MSTKKIIHTVEGNNDRNCTAFTSVIKGLPRPLVQSLLELDLWGPKGCSYDISCYALRMRNSIRTQSCEYVSSCYHIGWWKDVFHASRQSGSQWPPVHYSPFHLLTSNTYLNLDLVLDKESLDLKVLVHWNTKTLITVKSDNIQHTLGIQLPYHYPRWINQKK